MEEYIMVMTTTSKKEEAENIANTLVEQNLAASVQITSPIKSTYRWKNEINKNEEWLCLIKTSRKIYDKLEQAILEIHSYDTPEIIALPIVAGSNDYLGWLGSQLEEKK